jgi:hypothetical protein
MHVETNTGQRLTFQARLKTPTRTSKPLKPKIVYIFNHSVRTAKKTPHFTVTKIKYLTLFKEIIAVYCQNRMKQINAMCEEMQRYRLLKKVVSILTTAIYTIKGLTFPILIPTLRYYQTEWRPFLTKTQNHNIKMLRFGKTWS